MISYCVKYVTKCEPRSQSLKNVYAMIVRGLKEDDGALKAVQKLLISTTAERGYSICTGNLSPPFDASNVHGFT